MSSSTSTSSIKPTPLQAHASQEQSPIIENENDGRFEDGKISKPVNVVNTVPAAVVKPKVVVSKAKRGLKRL
jgi:hypothetical protein